MSRLFVFVGALAAAAQSQGSLSGVARRQLGSEPGDEVNCGDASPGCGSTECASSQEFIRQNGFMQGGMVSERPLGRNPPLTHTRARARTPSSNIRQRALVAGGMVCKQSSPPTTPSTNTLQRELVAAPVPGNRCWFWASGWVLAEPHPSPRRRSLFTGTRPSTTPATRRSTSPRPWCVCFFPFWVYLAHRAQLRRCCHQGRAPADLFSGLPLAAHTGRRSRSTPVPCPCAPCSTSTATRCTPSSPRTATT